MTVTQTIDIPANRRVFLDLPPELPVGRAQVELKVLPFPRQEKSAAGIYETATSLRGIAKKMGSTLTVEHFHEMMREEKILEEEQFERLSAKKVN